MDLCQKRNMDLKPSSVSHKKLHLDMIVVTEKREISALENYITYNHNLCL